MKLMCFRGNNEVSSHTKEIDNEVSGEMFAIRTLSEKTGVNSVTLRAWERRYGLLKPKRTVKGHRLYDDADVLRVEAIVRWIQQGVAVSKVRALLDDKAVSIDNVPRSNEWIDWQTQLVTASLSFEESKVEHLYHQVFSQYPPLVAVRNWIIPSLEKLNPGAGGHFCATVLIACLSARLTTLKNQHKESPVILIAGVSGQRSLWCFLASAILNDQGFSCLVMPIMSGIQNISDLVKGVNPHKVIVFAEGEFVTKFDDAISAMESWNRSVSIIGASFWLAAKDVELTPNDKLAIHSEPLEGILSFCTSG